MNNDDNDVNDFNDTKCIWGKLQLYIYEENKCALSLYSCMYKQTGTKSRVERRK